MKKIVFIHLFNDRSGSPKVLSQVVRAIHNHDVEIEVLTSGHDNGFLDDVPGLRRRIFYKRSENKIITLFYYLYSQVFLFVYCLRYCRSDVIFYVNTIMPFGALLIAKIMRKPVICHVHETSIKPMLLKQFLRSVIQLCASKVIFVSDYLRGKEGFSNLTQHVIHNAINQSVGRSSVKEPFKVLMICSLKAYKGVGEFLNLACALANRTDIVFELVLNAEQEEIQASSLLFDVPSNVNIYSRQSDVSKFYASASVLLNLSRMDEWVETFGLTVLEGMSFGLPVIVPPVGGPAEFVEDGQEGFLISCRDIERLVEAVQYMADNCDEYERLSIAARRRASQFNIEKFNEDIVRAVLGA
ncbi:glycosyltransferase family 4 protein [Pseudomonas urmiensis]|uniref:glycosyltransferase family 4 protein n=1 Tax=Pseudomonas urmiensis TaxID=2745493 RepID=UPI003D0C3ACE